MIDVFAIDDHPVVLEGLLNRFDPETDKVRLCGKAVSGEEAIRKLKGLHVQVILLDLSMPDINGTELIIDLKELWPDVKVIIHTGETNTTMLYNAWTKGADAILMKDCSRDELLFTIRSVVLDGLKIVGQSVPEFRYVHAVFDPLKPRLTRSETKVLKLLAQGHNREKTSLIMGITVGAVGFHTHHIYNKFGMRSLIEVVNKAREFGIID